MISTLVSSEQTPLFLSEGRFWTSFFQLETGGSAYKKYLLQRFNVRRVTDLDFLPWAITMAPLCSGVASDQVLPAGPRPWLHVGNPGHGLPSRAADPKVDGLRRKISLLGFIAVLLELTFLQELALLELCFHGELFN